MQDTRIQHHLPISTHRLSLAYVEDSHNLGCFVRLDGETTSRRAHFSPAIQHAGVVIRAGHIVVIDMTADPPEVVWRLGMRATVLGVDADQITLDLDYPNHRRLTRPLRDERPDDERASTLVVGDVVLLRGKFTEAPRISDVFSGDALAHPERLRALIANLSEHAGGAAPGQSRKL